MHNVISHTLTLECIECCTCGVVFAMPDSMMKHRRGDKGEFYCPSGHQQHFCRSEADKLRAQLDATNDELQRAKQQAATANTMREAAEQRAAKETRKAKRCENGVCIHCGRSFTSLRRHMASAHGIKNGESPQPPKPKVKP